MTKEYKGFVDEAIKLGAKMITGSVTILNKETYKINDNYIGVGKEVTFEWTYKEDADVHEIDMAMDAYARASVEHSIADQKETKGIIGGNWELRTSPATVAQPPLSKEAMNIVSAPPPERVAAVAAAVPPPSAPPQPPEAPQASGPGPSHETVRDCSISHQQTDTGIDYLLVKGGAWTKYGVKMWPEKVDEFISLDWRTWKIGTPYTLPEGYQEAVVQLKADGKPDRVIGLR